MENLGKKGVIGITKLKEAGTSWTMTYHEFETIANTYRQASHSDISNQELRVLHESTQANTNFTENSASSIVDYLIKHINPFEAGNVFFETLKLKSWSKKKMQN